MNLPRSSGILLHVTSLPDGRLGQSAYEFVDWLELAGQSWWQILPLGPPDKNGSPYMPSSAFAASPALLADSGASVSKEEILTFRARGAYWARDWERLGGGTIADQVRFDREWGELRAYAAARGVRLIGDVPIYVAPRSADHLAHPDLFQQGVVAGAPPDELSTAGQLWQNPLYDWRAMRRQGYLWWIERLRRTADLVDLARIDHFRGFVSYWSVPEDARTASAGRWRRGPGVAPFRAAEHELGPLPLIVEDLGTVTAPVYRLRDELGLPGTVVLQFAFGRRHSAPHRIERHTRNLVVYTGTHDTDTTVGWWQSLDHAQRAATHLDPAKPHWSLIELAMSSAAALAVISCAGCARPRQRGAHEHPGDDLRQLALAPRAGSAHDRSRRSAASRTEASSRLAAHAP